MAPQSVDRAMMDLDTVIASMAGLRAEIRTSAACVRAERMRLANEAADRICRVCLEPMGRTRIQLECGHHFCSACSNMWVSTWQGRYGSDGCTAPCPLCRSVVGRADSTVTCNERESEPQGNGNEQETSADGDGVTVLEEDVDEDYEPSDAEISVYFDWLGMVSPDHDDLRWLCRAALKEPLPAGWKPCRSSDGEVFYYNYDTGESVWDHPCDTRYRKLFEEEKLKRVQADCAAKSNRTHEGASSSKQGSTSREAVEAYRAFQQSLASR